MGGAFSGIPTKTTIEKVVEAGLPYANGYTGFWENPITIQNPFASIEMVLWDGGLALIISRDEKITNDFLNHYKSGEDLEKYNSRNKHLKLLDY